MCVSVHTRECVRDCVRARECARVLRVRAILFSLKLRVRAILFSLMGVFVRA